MERMELEPLVDDVEALEAPRLADGSSHDTAIKPLWFYLIPMTDPNGAAICGVPWIPSIYPSYVSIYTSTMDPMGYVSGQIITTEPCSPEPWNHGF